MPKIHGYTDPEGAQTMQGGEVGFACRQEKGFRDFEFEAPRRQASVREGRQNDMRQITVLELNRRKIHRDLQIVRPRGRLGAGFSQCPFADRDNQADLLGERNEIGRATMPRTGWCQRSNASKPEIRPVSRVTRG